MISLSHKKQSQVIILENTKRDYDEYRGFFSIEHLSLSVRKKILKNLLKYNNA